MSQARDAYAAARSAYSAARNQQAPVVAQIGQTVEDLLERTRCQLDRDEIDRLHLAYSRVAQRLQRCGEGLGCCVDDAENNDDYDQRVRDCDPEETAGLIALLTQRTADAKACFDELITEAASEMAARVGRLTAEVDAIKAALTDGSKDAVTLYVEVLVARRHLREVWRGFGNVNDYMECLCEALARFVTGHAAIGELTRKAAVHECHRKTWEDAGATLRSQTAAEVVAEYLRVCRERDDDDAPPREDSDEDDGRSDEDDHHGHGRNGGHRGERPTRDNGPRARQSARPSEEPDDRDEDVSIDIDIDVDVDDDDEASPRRRRPRRPYQDDSGAYRAP